MRNHVNGGPPLGLVLCVPELCRPDTAGAVSIARRRRRGRASSAPACAGRNSPHRKTRSAAEAGFQFEAGVEHEHVCPEDTSADLKRPGIEYVLVREEVLKEGFNCSLDDWLKRMKARVVQKIPLNRRASKGALDWYLIQLR
jgi:hypothetical protein